MKVLALDFETSIGKTIHGATFRDGNNDVFTIIAATTPENVEVNHSERGWKRCVNYTVSGNMDVDYIVGHNIGFDLSYIWDDQYIKKYLTKGGKIWDTQYVEYLLTGQQHTTSSLAELQLKYLGEREKPTRIGLLYKKGVGADKILAKQDQCPRLFKLYNEYCRTDGSTPLKIFKAQYIKAKREGMLPLIELYNDYLLGQINMSCTGIRIDVLKAEKLLKEYNIKHLEYLQQAQDILKSVWTDPRLPAFNINSVDHKSAVLFGGIIKVVAKVHNGFFKNGNPRYNNQVFNITVRGFGLNTSLTHSSKKEGFYSTDDKTLANIKADSRTPNEVLRYCELQELSMKYKKAAKTYCQAFLDRNVEGILYPHFNNTITPTGRLSSSEPNMQNIPSKNELAQDLMGCLIAPPPMIINGIKHGWKCVTVDFSQLEKWTQALVSKDENLIEALMSGKCMHCVILAKKEHKEYEWVYQKAKVEQNKEWDTKRTHIKPVGFLMDYGGMQERVASETDLPLEEVQEIFRIDRELYPDKYKFFEEELPAAVKVSTTFSLAANIAKSKTKGKDGCQLFGKAELLPIFDKVGNVHYNNQELRHVGYWITEYGKKYHFVDFGRYNKDGSVRRNYPMPRFKNYPNQGGAADIQAATTAEILQVLLSKRDKIKMHLEIHDSKLFTIREDVLEPCLKWLKETIEDVPKIFKRRFGINIPFKFPVEIKIGDNFGEMVKYEVN